MTAAREPAGTAVAVATADPVRDPARLAALHRAALPGSILSALGERAVTRYYAVVTRSAVDHVFVASLDGVVEGGCVASRAPGSLLRRFALAAPGRLIGELARELAASHALRRRLVRRLGERGPGGPELPEVTQIFTAARHRGRGVGSALLRACEDALRRAGAAGYCIRTLRDDNAAGIRFYHREGFATAGELRSFGDHYLIMTKGLS